MLVNACQAKSWLVDAGGTICPLTAVYEPVRKVHLN